MKVMIGLLTTLALSLGTLSAENEDLPSLDALIAANSDYYYAPSAGTNAGYRIIPIGVGLLGLSTLAAIVLAINGNEGGSSQHSHN